MTLYQQVEESLAVLVVKLPMVVPIQREQRGVTGGVNGQHEGPFESLNYSGRKKKSPGNSGIFKVMNSSELGRCLAVMGVGQY
ncbi:MAG: hypothetical protein TH68_07690 [Candidatus Synechococcus spongiarum 142]|uniref:Uncharacterized protein n=1 Tax=Candidatus Synechococcus spongiarum 142 TaxID=1608213 RepID=A0A6N3X7E7_9SYNE|nr:MAG: hypothetical protein TH68_07690 [Candidatus Synechococcus spongiarum 142]